METLLSALNSYSNLITAGATAVLALLTAFLWFENRGLRKAGHAPEIVTFLRSHPDGSGGVEFVLSNVGRGPAFDVEFRLLADDSDFTSHRVALLNDKDRKPISVIPQNESITALFGVGFELYGNVGEKPIDPLKPFVVQVEFVDSFGKKRTAQRTIDIRQFAGLRGIIAKSPIVKVSESLQKIEKHLSSIAQQQKRTARLIDSTQMHDQYVQKRMGNPEDE